MPLMVFCVRSTDKLIRKLKTGSVEAPLDLVFVRGCLDLNGDSEEYLAPDCDWGTLDPLGDLCVNNCIIMRATNIHDDAYVKQCINQINALGLSKKPYTFESIVTQVFDENGHWRLMDM